MKKLAFTIALLLITTFTFSQTVRTVGFGAQFETFQEAVDASIAGDIIHVHPITSSYGNVIIDKELHIIGLGHNPADHNEGIVAMFDTVYFSEDADNSTVSGVQVRYFSAYNIANIDNVKISNCKILYSIKTLYSTGTGWIVEGCYFSHSSANVNNVNGMSEFTLKNNFFRGYLKDLDSDDFVYNSIFLTNSYSHATFLSCTNLPVANSIFIGTHASYDSVSLSSSTIDGMNNLTFNTTGTTIDPLFGIDNLNNTDPQFTTITAGDYFDFYNNDYSLQATSPGVNYGVDGTDIGVYGTEYKFDNNGWPYLIPRPTEVNVTTPIISYGAGQSLEFNFTAKQRD